MVKIEIGMMMLSETGSNTGKKAKKKKKKAKKVEVASSDSEEVKLQFLKIRLKYLIKVVQLNPLISSMLEW